MKRGLVLFACVFLVMGAMNVQASSPFDRGFVFDEMALKGTDDSSGSGVGGRDSGGPDGFGYTFADTAEPSCSYQWIDISGTGTQVVLGDDAGVTVSLSEPFSLYDSSVSSVGFNSNGFLSTTDDASGDLTNDCPLPASPSTGTGARIYAVHDDLVTDFGYHEYFASCPKPDSTGAGSCTVFLWDEAVHYGDTNAFDFEVILYHGSGEMAIQWDDRNPEAGSSSTTGIQNAAADIGLTYVCETAASLPADSGVCFGLGGLGGDLAITLTSTAANLALNEPFTWDLGAANLGGGTQNNVVVTGTYPASVAIDGTSCGATVAGGVITWNVGTMTDGASDTCVVNATLVNCAAVPLTASIGGDDFDLPSNNSATLDISISGGEAINDGGFETGTPNAAWSEASVNFGTPICDLANCGTGTGTGPNNGDYWVWFGGVSGYEEGSVSQTVVIDPGASIDFWVEAIICDSAADYVELTVDGNQVWSLDGGSPLCGVLGYSMQTVSLVGYDDGASHLLEFHSENFAQNGGGSNFFIDDVSMLSACDTYQPPQPTEAIPTIGRLGLFLMIGLLAVVGILIVRRVSR